jgi:hypothetical protein
MMKKAWNKGLTKENSISVRKISKTMQSKKIDNFKKWRDSQKEYGKIKSSYPPFKKSKELAELIGVVLGDGHIGKLARTESLRIVGNSSNQGFTNRYAKMIEQVFNKKPHVAKRGTSNANNITIYEKEISKRLGIPLGSRAGLDFPVPLWILSKKVYTIAYLRGLYEAEGCYSVHLATYTHKFTFSNRNESLLLNVYTLVSAMGFHPHRSKYQIQVSRKEEVQKLKNLLEFRRY